jgi:AcrR family transcriptional regulator
MQESGGPALTVQATAAAAGVGRQTIYRWWPGKGALIADALAERARVIIDVPDTGSFRDDLAGFLMASFVDATKNARILRQFMALAQQDSDIAAVAPDFAASRRAPFRTLIERERDRGDLAAVVDIDVLGDLAYGFLWYRLLLGHASLDERAARQLADALIATGRQPTPHWSGQAR